MTPLGSTSGVTALYHIIWHDLGIRAGSSVRWSPRSHLFQYCSCRNMDRTKLVPMQAQTVGTGDKSIGIYVHIWKLLCGTWLPVTDPFSFSDNTQSTPVVDRLEARVRNGFPMFEKGIEGVGTFCIPVTGVSIRICGREVEEGGRFKNQRTKLSCYYLGQWFVGLRQPAVMEMYAMRMWAVYQRRRRPKGPVGRIFEWVCLKGNVIRMSWLMWIEAIVNPIKKMV